MKERPILFSAPMVRALLDGSKTQTRRIVKPQPPTEVRDFCTYHHPKPGLWFYGWDEADKSLLEWCVKSRHGQPGGQLWVRETWQKAGGNTGYWYAATDSHADDGNSPVSHWKPSIHMPRAVSRITLEITGVRVERLQDISRGDAMAEGCPFPNMADGDDPRKWYADLWGQINGADSWDANPWVWVVEFKVVKP